MVAAIDTTNGVSLFASFREPAWHRLGNVFTQKITDFKKMLVAAGMNDLDIRFEEISLPAFPGAKFVVPAVAVVRTNPVNGATEVLGIVGERYEIITLEESFGFLQSLADGLRWETAGLIKGGRVAFGSIAYERETVLDPTGVADVVKNYLLLKTSFDGSSGLTGGRTGVRVVCSNTLDMAMGNIDQTFNVRHTLNYSDRMAKVQIELAKSEKFFDEFDKGAKALFAKAVTDKQYFGLVETLFPKPEKDVKGAVTKWETRQETFSQAWKGEPNAGIRNTAWGVLNALTEANQWGRKMRVGDKGAENFFAAGAGFDAPTKAFRNDALVLARSL